MQSDTTMNFIDKVRARNALIDEAQTLDQKADEFSDGLGKHPFYRKRAFQKRESARNIDEEL